MPLAVGISTGDGATALIDSPAAVFKPPTSLKAVEGAAFVVKGSPFHLFLGGAQVPFGNPSIDCAGNVTGISVVVPEITARMKNPPSVNVPHSVKRPAEDHPGHGPVWPHSDAQRR